MASNKQDTQKIVAFLVQLKEGHPRSGHPVRAMARELEIPFRRCCHLTRKLCAHDHRFEYEMAYESVPARVFWH